MSTLDKERLVWPTLKQAELIHYWSAELEKYGTEEILYWAAENFPSRLAVVVSSDPGSSILVSLLSETEPRADMFFIDTGCHFPETHDYLEQLESKYAVQIRCYSSAIVYAESTNAAETTTQPTNPYRCCYERKYKVLKEIASDYDAVICSSRREQGGERSFMPILDWDERFGLIRIAPLARWSKQMVWEKIQAEKIPYNKLYDMGYEYVDCMPCTQFHYDSC